jgi:hypothetical protein
MIALRWLARIAAPMVRSTRITAGFLLVFAACPGTALARLAPEIDPGTASSALGLLAGGFLLLTDRFRRNK